ncbi:hypothetical protein [Streptomyces sp. SID3212]|uniref:hypothetical protein n=1 Tax=Streptomyces sp. SID3212 TaxID=2690259 RepID=UPI001369963D|nr:hypothetical protein [Streptomyces sp. SID3212]MYV54048.1 hypothetical protein [Streptomyces sp. SID3212]
MSASGGTAQWLGLAGILVLFITLTLWLVRRAGGPRAVWRRTARQVRLTRRAFSEPVRAQLRYRRRVRLLGRLLRDRAGWADAERAVRLAARLHPGFAPYGALLGPDLVGVLVTGRSDNTAVGKTGSGTVPDLPEPWAADDAEPRLWWIARSDVATAEEPDAEVAGEPAGADGVSDPASPASPASPPLLCCVGTDGRRAVLLDLHASPATVAVLGVPRTARAVVQSLAAQLDARLPAGSVEVASGVHPRYAGRTAAEVLAAPVGTYVVCAEPPRTPVPDGVRLLCLGVGRGRALLLEASPEGLLEVHGAAPSLRVDALPLTRAVVRALPTLPPYDDAAGVGVGAGVGAGADISAPGPASDGERTGAGDATATVNSARSGAGSGTAPAGSGATRPRPVAVTPDEFEEPEATVGASAVPQSPEHPGTRTPPAVRRTGPSAPASLPRPGDDDLAEPSESGTAGVSAAGASAAGAAPAARGKS